MKTIYGTILVLITAAAMLLIVPPACRAVEKEQESIWSEGELDTHRRWELTDARIERMMSRLRQTEPEKAKELAKLREQEPEKFKDELRKAMREQFGKRFKEQKGQSADRRWQEHGMMRPGCPAEPPRIGPPPRVHRAPAEGRKGEMIRNRMCEEHAEYLEWLKKNYPEEAEKLAGLKDRKPKLHTRRMALALKKYRRIFEAERENPELAKVLKEDLELKEERNKLLRKIRASVNDAEKKRLTEELEEVVSSRFDLIVKRKQIEYEQLSEKLEKLKEQVKRSEAEVEKWENIKDKEVKQRVEELISRTEKFSWE